MLMLILHTIVIFTFSILVIQTARDKYRPSKLAVVILLVIVALDSTIPVLEFALNYSQG